MSTELVKNVSKRNFSFLERDSDFLDQVEDGDKTFIVPAQPGSCYWAILRVGYENHDKPIGIEDYINLVANLMKERDPEKWEKFKNKSTVKTLKNGVTISKDANNWRFRIETNIKTMTRQSGASPYGQRLHERGHILRWEPWHFNGKGGYILRTDTNKTLKEEKN